MYLSEWAVLFIYVFLVITCVCVHVLDLSSVFSQFTLPLLRFSGSQHPLWTSRSNLSWRTGYLFQHFCGQNTADHSRRGKQFTGSCKQPLNNESFMTFVLMFGLKRSCHMIISRVAQPFDKGDNEIERGNDEKKDKTKETKME